MSDGSRVGVVLTAGGARGAYQAGALAEVLPMLAAAGQRPRVLVGESVGALNAVALAAAAHLPAQEQAATLLDHWTQATKPRVLRPLWQQLPLIAVRYGAETLGVPRLRLRGLLGVEPLRRTVGELIDWDRLHGNIRDGRIDRLAVAATQVATGRTIAFVEAHDHTTPEQTRDVDYEPTRLGVDHVLASAAIPMLFPPVWIAAPDRAAAWYADGCTRLHAPLQPAVDAGVDRLLVVGTTSLRRWPDRDDDRAVDLGDAAVTLLHAMVADSLRDDVARLAAINAHLVGDGPEHAAVHRLRAARGRAPYRRIPYIAIAPDDPYELGDVALEVFRARYRTWRGVRDPDIEAMHRLLGGDSPLQGELLSFVLFDREFHRRLVDLGRRDARAWLDAHRDDPWVTAEHAA